MSYSYLSLERKASILMVCTQSTCTVYTSHLNLSINSDANQFL
jgi:hypothetical protein